jgi:hypothetical protein
MKFQPHQLSSDQRQTGMAETPTSNQQNRKSNAHTPDGGSVAAKVFHYEQTSRESNAVSIDPITSLSHPPSLDATLHLIARDLPRDRLKELPLYVREHPTSLTFPEKVRLLSRKSFVDWKWQPTAQFSLLAKLMVLVRYAECRYGSKSSHGFYDTRRCPIGWTSDGNFIVVRQQEQLLCDILPLFGLRVSKFHSFVRYARHLDLVRLLTCSMSSLTVFYVACESRKLYRWGFRQVKSEGQTLFCCSDFRRDDPRRISRMRNVTSSEKQRHENTKSVLVGEHRDSSPSKAVASQDAFLQDTEISRYSLPDPPISVSYKNDGVKAAPGDSDQISSNSCKMQNSCSDGNSLAHTDLDHNEPWLSVGAEISSLQSIQPQLTTDSPDHWFQVLVDEYDKNQLCRLKSPTASACFQAMEQGSRIQYPKHGSGGTQESCW